jgi:hypothetical protein
VDAPLHAEGTAQSGRHSAGGACSKRRVRGHPRCGCERPARNSGPVVAGRRTPRYRARGGLE